MTVEALCDHKTGLYRLTDNQGKTVTEANEFLRSLELRGLSPDTIRAYAFDLVVLYRFLEKVGKEITELCERDLVDFIAVERKRDAHPHSINRRLTTSRLIYRFLTGEELEHSLLVHAPAAYYRGPGRDKNLGIHVLQKRRHLVLKVSVPQTIVEPLTPEQVRTFLRGLKRLRDLSIVHLMLLCGLRSKEVLALTLWDITFHESRMRIHGKGDKERILPLPDILAKMIQSYLRLERPHHCSDDALFVVLQGKRRGCGMTRSGLRRLFRYWRTRQGVDQANPHRFRHTFGADMARSGVPLSVLQKMMGHSDSRTTTQYINLSMADIAEEFQRASNVIQSRYQLQEEL